MYYENFFCPVQRDLSVNSVIGWAFAGAVGIKVLETIPKKRNVIGVLPESIIKLISDISKGPLNKRLVETNLVLFRLFRSYKLASTIAVPVVEEAIFRAGLQQIFTKVL